MLRILAAASGYNSVFPPPNADLYLTPHVFVGGMTIPPKHQMKMMLQSTDAIPMNFGFTGKGNTSKPEGLMEVSSSV